MNVHLTATTAEAMRTAAVEWLDAKSADFKTRADASIYARDIADYKARSAALRDAARFFRDMTIDPA